MTKAKLGLGIIGCGRISFAHAEACQNLQDRVVIQAAADLDEAKLANFSEMTSLPNQFADYRQLLKQPDVEAVIICLPHVLHYPVAVDALRAGKHVLVEKPMALTYDQAMTMVTEADLASRVLMVGQSRRFSHAAIEMKRMVEDGEIGQLFRIIVNFLCFFEKAPTQWWNDKHIAGASLVTVLQGSHAFDEISWIFGRTPRCVYATSFTKNLHDDESDILLDYGDATAAVHLSLNTRPPLIHEVLAVGAHGVMKLSEWRDEKPFSYGYRFEVNSRTVVEGLQKPSIFTLQLEEFVASVTENRRPVASGREIASTTMRIMSAAVESAVSKKPVML